MIYHVFAIFDHKIRAFMKPLQYVVPQQAVRDFITLCNDGDTQVGKHPEDFTLFQIAEYDDEKGEYVNVKHINHGTAMSWQRKGEP